MSIWKLLAQFTVLLASVSNAYIKYKKNKYIFARFTHEHKVFRGEVIFENFAISVSISASAFTIIKNFIIVLNNIIHRAF